MSSRLDAHEHLEAPVSSPSGTWSLTYDHEGRAVVVDAAGTTTWRAGAPGRLSLELAGDLVVRRGEEEVWRHRLPAPRQIDSLCVTDDGDALICRSGDVAVHSLVHGPVETVVLGDRAPFAELGDGRCIQWEDGRRSATVSLTGELREERADHRGMPQGSSGLAPSEAQRLDRPDTWLTWRFLDDDQGFGWDLVLLDAADRVVWALHRGDVDPAKDCAGTAGPASAPARTPTTPATPGPELPVAESGEYDAEWEDVLGLDDWYCVTVIRDVTPDQALTALGAAPEEITTATEDQLWRRYSYEDRTGHDNAAIAFALGPHTLLVEHSGWEGWDSPGLSAGTFAVSVYSVMGDERFMVSRDGQTLAGYQDEAFGEPGIGDPEAAVIAPALREMGYDQLAERNLAHRPFHVANGWEEDLDEDEEHEDEDQEVDSLELMCRVARVRPTPAHVRAPGRVWTAPAR
ncbi:MULTISPECIES: DUF6461 domain-containing protein [unclassified Streptomyces]|uniref:DUF6461 domain-containing protein n=1 Tax=unclassified Streptomyces TaxID=2593676 RepID=UPI000CD49E7F|nr:MULTISPECIES: DUF6461 domain-containing protein [unclassified Streptomyces]